MPRCSSDRRTPGHLLVASFVWLRLIPCAKGQPALSCWRVNGTKKKLSAAPKPADALQCALSQVGVGASVRIKQLAGCPEMSQRLREMGVCEEQKIKVLLKQSSLICQVCNLRLGLSSKLADQIIVERLPKPLKASS